MHAPMVKLSDMLVFVFFEPGGDRLEAAKQAIGYIKLQDTLKPCPIEDIQLMKKVYKQRNILEGNFELFLI